MFGSISTKIAHGTTLPSLGNQDLRQLQDVLIKEKEIVGSVQKVSRDLGAAADAMKMWGDAEGEDLNDILGHTATLTNHLTAALNRFADLEVTMRANMKDIRNKEEQLEELRRRRRAVGVKAEAAEKKLQKMGSENKALLLQQETLQKLKEEMRTLDATIYAEMARLSDYKRSTTRKVLTLKFGGLAEVASVMAIVADFGNQIADEIPKELTTPGQGRAAYHGRERTQALVLECAKFIGDVNFNTGGQLGAPPQSHSRNPSDSASQFGSLGGRPTHGQYGSINSLGGMLENQNTGSSVGPGGNYLQPPQGPPAGFGGHERKDSDLRGARIPPPTWDGNTSSPRPSDQPSQSRLNEPLQDRYNDRQYTEQQSYPDSRYSDRQPSPSRYPPPEQQRYGTERRPRNSDEFSAPPLQQERLAVNLPKSSTSSSQPVSSGLPINVPLGSSSNKPVASAGRDYPDSTLRSEEWKQQQPQTRPTRQNTPPPSSYQAPEPEQLDEPFSKVTLQRTATLPPNLPTLNIGGGFGSGLGLGFDDDDSSPVAAQEPVTKVQQEAVLPESPAPAPPAKPAPTRNEDSPPSPVVMIDPETLLPVVMPVIRQASFIHDPPNARSASGTFARFPVKPLARAGSTGGAIPSGDPTPKATVGELPINVGRTITPVSPEVANPRPMNKPSIDGMKSILEQQSVGGSQRIKWAPPPTIPVTPDTSNEDDNESELAYRSTDDHTSSKVGAIAPLGIRKDRNSGDYSGRVPPRPKISDPGMSEEKLNEMIDDMQQQVGADSSISSTQSSSFGASNNRTPASTRPTMISSEEIYTESPSAASLRSSEKPYPEEDDRYPGPGDKSRYPKEDDRYPPANERYPPANERYPPANDRNPPANDRNPPANDRNPPGGNRYPPANDKYPDDRQTSPSRYPAARPEDRYPSNRDVEGRNIAGVGYGGGPPRRGPDDSYPGPQKTITAAAFQKPPGASRMPGLPSHPAAGRLRDDGPNHFKNASAEYGQGQSPPDPRYRTAGDRMAQADSPSMGPARVPYQQSAQPERYTPPLTRDAYPPPGRGSDRAVSPPTPVDRSADSSLGYYGDRSAPYIQTDEFGSLPRGAAPPQIRGGHPEPGRVNDGSLRGAANGSPSGSPSLSPGIPMALRPGTPSTRSPLAPIGLKGPPPASPAGLSPGYGAFPHSGPGAPPQNVQAPWFQQQNQGASHLPPEPYSPMGEIVDAYGGIDDHRSSGYSQYSSQSSPGQVAGNRNTGPYGQGGATNYR